MKKNIGNITAAMAVFMAVAGFGMGSRAGSFEVRAEKQEAKADDKKSTDSDAKEEETTKEQESTQEAVNEEEGTKAERRLPEGFSVSGLDDSVKTMTALNEALEKLQNKLDEKKFILSVNGEQIESSFSDLGASIENKEYILSEAGKYTSGNMIERFAKSAGLIENPESITPDIEFNEEALNSFFNRANSKNPNAPVNATIKRVNGAFEITPEHDGYAIDKESTVDKLKEAILKTGEETIEAQVTKQEATVKAEDLKDIKDVLGTFTTNYSSSTSERATNIAVGTQKMDGVLLMPGETISGYERMQPFTIKNGYKMAKAYQNGLVVDSVGGGACQIATTLYQAALRAEVKITERKNHSMIVGYVQPSGDAAIAGDYKDIKVTNNRSTPIYVEAVTSGRNVTFTIWGKEDRSANRTIEFVSEVINETPKGKTYKDDPSKPVGYVRKESDGHKGRTSKLWKVVKENGVEVSRELVSSDTYRMADDIYIRGTRVDAPAPTAAPVENTEGGGEAANDAPADNGPADNSVDVSQGPGFDPNINSGQ
ncbi:VanW family protein [Lachnoanaerobaculum gingivalis]|uniref:VanW family protein n=1 Tax=Lachnoanaerobaculum gingivalis TaxID=2490855 RepID=UPI0024A67843|nr:VanW family protein [Lachnoanaerobaculum gingivalis]WHE86354.1 VanW family protein [Lachnoanaerobaculum gingivalis]